jgi:hypothetical protein
MKRHVVGLQVGEQARQVGADLIERGSHLDTCLNSLAMMCEGAWFTQAGGWSSLPEENRGCGGGDTGSRPLFSWPAQSRRRSTQGPCQ